MLRMAVVPIRGLSIRWRMTMRTAIRRLGQTLRALALITLPALGGSVSAQSAPDLGAAIDDLVAANRILYRQGVVDGFGHISTRHPERKDRFLMSASLVPGRVGKADIMEFDLESKPVDQRGRSIYSERFIHSEIYKARPDVNAVLHSHSPTVIPFSVSQVPLRPILNSAGFLAPNVPVFEMRRVRARAASWSPIRRAARRWPRRSATARSRSCAAMAMW